MYVDLVVIWLFVFGKYVSVCCFQLWLYYCENYYIVFEVEIFFVIGIEIIKKDILKCFFNVWFELFIVFSVYFFGQMCYFVFVIFL